MRIKTLILLLIISIKINFSFSVNVDSLKSTLDLSSVHDTNKAINCYNLFLHYEFNDTTIALNYLEKGKGLTQENYPFWLSHYYVYKAWYEEDRGRLDGALENYTNAKNIREKLNKSASYYDVVYNMGIIYRKQGDYNKALTYYKNAFDYFKISNQTNRLAGANNGMAIIYESMGNLPKALEMYMESLNYLDSTKENYHSIKGNLYSNISLIYRDINEFELAIDFLNKAKASFEKGEVLKGLARAYNNFGLLYKKMNEYDEALINLVKAYEIEKKIGDEYDIANNLGNIGRIYFLKENYDTALFYFNKALKLKEKTGHKRGIPTSYNNIAESKLKLGGNINEIIQTYLLPSYTICKENNYAEELINSTDLLSKNYEKTGNFQMALDYYKEYTSLKDSIFNESKSKEIGKLEAQYEFEKQQEDEKRKEEIRNQKIENERLRKNNLQYSGIFVVVLVLFALVFMTGKFTMSERIAEGLIFFTFLLFFEFLLVLLDPSIEQWSGGEPAYKLILNAILAATIFPLHAFFEGKLKKRITKYSSI